MSWSKVTILEYKRRKSALALGVGCFYRVAVYSTVGNSETYFALHYPQLVNKSPVFGGTPCECPSPKNRALYARCINGHMEVI